MSTLSRKQKAAIHVAARGLGLIDKFGNAEQYRMVLRNVTGKESCTRMTQSDYDRLCAWFKTQGIVIGNQAVMGVSYSDITNRQVHKLNALIAELPDVNLPGVVHQATGGAQTLISECTAAEASKVIEALIDIINRRELHRARSGGLRILRFPPDRRSTRFANREPSTGETV